MHWPRKHLKQKWRSASAAYFSVSMQCLRPCTLFIAATLFLFLCFPLTVSIFKASTPYLIIYTLLAVVLPVEEADGSGWGIRGGCTFLSPFWSQFCIWPCFISLPLQRVPLLCNILQQSTDQTFTAPHAKDYFSLPHRATFCCASSFVPGTDAALLLVTKKDSYLFLCVHFNT